MSLDLFHVAGEVKLQYWLRVRISLFKFLSDVLDSDARSSMVLFIFNLRLLLNVLSVKFIFAWGFKNSLNLWLWKWRKVVYILLTFTKLTMLVFNMPEVAWTLPESLGALAEVAFVRSFSCMLVLMLSLIYFERKCLSAKLACESLNIEMKVLVMSRSTILIDIFLVAAIEFAMVPRLRGLHLARLIYFVIPLNVLFF